MKYIKKILSILISIFFFTFFLISYSLAGRGCCSSHGGQAYCASNGRRVCNDGTYSPSCTCGGSTSYNQSNYYKTYYCPANSKETIDGKCECNVGYKSNMLNNGCEPDQNYHCNTKYPGTIRDNKTNMCICPKGNPMGWNPDKKGCPITDNECSSEFGFGSIAIDYDKCTCKDGYKWDDPINMNKCVYISQTKDNNSDSSFGLVVGFLIIGGIIYGIIKNNNNKKQ